MFEFGANAHFLPNKGTWDCIEIRGTALNQGSRDVTAAAVFGQVRDAEGFACLSTALDDSIKTGIASLGALQKGKKTPVSFVVAVQARSPRPLSLVGFKAVTNTLFGRTQASVPARLLSLVSTADQATTLPPPC